MVEALLRRDRWIVMAALVGLFALCVAYLARGAGLDMSISAMTNHALFPHTVTAPDMDMGMGMDMPMSMPIDQGWSLSHALLMIAMWWVMMIAMMTPSAAPMMLLFARVTRFAAERGQVPAGAVSNTALFLAGYLVAWLGFSVAATAAQWTLERLALISPVSMWSANRFLSVGVLLAAGLYQITSFKNACLQHCRAPADFLSRHWQPGAAGTLNLGLRHGAYCVGCCWALMALLFVGGVMNPVWIAAIAILVLLEKTLPGDRWLSRVTGGLFMVWGVATLLV